MYVYKNLSQFIETISLNRHKKPLFVSHAFTRVQSKGENGWRHLNRDIFIDKPDWRTWSILPDVYSEDKHLCMRLTNWSGGKQLILFPSNLNVSRESRKTKLTGSWATSH